MIPTIEALRENLQKEWVIVTFKKADGTLRDMKCTLNFDLIPVEAHPKPKPKVEESDERFVVEEVKKEVDLALFKVYEDGKGWRSFRHETVEMVKYA